MKPTITVKQAAELANCTKGNIFFHINAGKFKAKKEKDMYGQGYFAIDMKSFQKWLKGRRLNDS